MVRRRIVKGTSLLLSARGHGEEEIEDGAAELE